MISSTSGTEWSMVSNEYSPIVTWLPMTLEKYQ